MNILHYFKPVNLTQSEVKQAGVKAIKQEIVCLNILRQSGKPLTTYEVYSEFLRIIKKDVPYSSIVRAISRLKSGGDIEPATDKDGKNLYSLGKYYRYRHLWKLTSK